MLGQAALRTMQGKADTDFILGMIERYGRELYWVTSGPPYRHCQVLRKDNLHSRKAGAVYVMGGAIASRAAGTYTGKRSLSQM